MRTGWNSLEEQFSERDLLTYRLSAPPLPPPRRAFFFSIFLFCFLFSPFNFFRPFLLLFYFLPNHFYQFRIETVVDRRTPTEVEEVVLEGRRATWLRVRTSAGESKRVVLWTRPTDLSTRRSTPTPPSSLPVFLSTPPLLQLFYRPAFVGVPRRPIRNSISCLTPDKGNVREGRYYIYVNTYII